MHISHSRGASGGVTVKLPNRAQMLEKINAQHQAETRPSPHDTARKHSLHHFGSSALPNTTNPNGTALTSNNSNGNGNGVLTSASHNHRVLSATDSMSPKRTDTNVPTLAHFGSSPSTHYTHLTSPTQGGIANGLLSPTTNNTTINSARNEAHSPLPGQLNTHQSSTSNYGTYFNTNNGINAMVTATPSAASMVASTGSLSTLSHNQGGGANALRIEVDMPLMSTGGLRRLSLIPPTPSVLAVDSPSPPAMPHTHSATHTDTAPHSPAVYSSVVNGSNGNGELRSAMYLRPTSSVSLPNTRNLPTPI
jgi:hypothetical protein